MLPHGSARLKKNKPLTIAVIAGIGSLLHLSAFAETTDKKTNKPAAAATDTTTQTTTTTTATKATIKADTKATSTTTTNDKLNIKGDWISFPIRRTGKYKDDPNDTEFCIPAKTGMEGMGKIANGQMPVRLIDKKLSALKVCDGETKLDTDRMVEVNNADNADFSRYGFSYGTLIVPYKYFRGGSKSLKGNTTLGGYFGRRFDPNEWGGIEVNVVAFMGAATAEAKTVNEAGEEKSENLIGVSYGGGFIFTVKDDFQSGIILGKDRYGTGGDEKIEDAGKTWVAIAIGFDFGN